MSSHSTHTVKFAVISDIHCGPDMETREGSRAPDMLKKTLSHLRNEELSFVIDLGDRINDVDRENDHASLRTIAQIYQECGCPVYFAYGNHDTINLPKEAQNDIFSKPGACQIIEFDERLRFVILDSVDPTVNRVGGTISESQLEWLDTAVDSDKETIVFVHHPIDPQDVHFHWYFGHNPQYATAANGDRALALLSRVRCRAIFNGHMHWIHRGMASGIPTITVPSFIDTTFTRNAPPGFFTIVECNSKSLTTSFETVTGTFMKWEVQ